MALPWLDLKWIPRLLQASPRERVIRWFVAAGYLAHGTGASAAQSTGTFLLVQREPGSELCPDADAVFRAMQTLYPERAFHRVGATEQAVASARVVVRPTPHGHEATVQTLSPRPGQRVIVDQDANCRGLGDALAVAFAVLLDASDEAAPPVIDHSPPTVPMNLVPTSAEPEVIVPATAPTAPPATKSSSAPHQPQTPTKPARAVAIPSWSTHGRVGALGSVFELTQPAIGVAAGGDLFHQSGLGLELAALGLWAQPAKAGEGSIAVSRYGARLGVCYQRTAFARSQYFLCAEFGAGSQRSRTEGFAIVFEDARNDAWLTLGPKLGYLQELSTWLHGVVSLGLASNLVRNNLVVAGNPALRVEAQLLGLSAEIGLRLAGPRF